MCLDGEYWKKLWQLKLPGKVLNLLWRASRNVLPTVKALASKNVNIQLMCPWCRLEVEDDIHVLFRCEFAQEVWRKAGLTALVATDLNETFFDVMKRVFQMGNKKQVLMSCLLCWNLWQQRNTWVWDHVNISPFGLHSRACSMLEEWKRAKAEYDKPGVKHCIGNQKWSKPPTVGLR